MSDYTSEYVCACGHEADRHRDGGCIGSFGGPLGQGSFSGCDCHTEYGDQLDIFSALGDVIPSRASDPETSHAAAREVRVKAGTQRARLLLSFYDWDGLDMGLTDEQAMKKAVGVSATSEYAKRCSELRDGGFIEPTGETRAGSAGPQRIVSRITDKGRAWIRENR